MKRLLFISLLAIAVVFSAYSQNGVIRELTGEVGLKPAGAAAFAVAQQGVVVANDTIISTGFKSMVVIEVGSTVLTVQPLTRLSLSEIQRTSSTETLNVNLESGRVRVDVNPPAGTRARTSVQSPSATASVRGTSFWMDTRNLKVTHGNVGFTGSDGITMNVHRNSSSKVTADGSAQSPVEVVAQEVRPPRPVGIGNNAAGNSIGGTAPSTSDGVPLGISIGFN